MEQRLDAITGLRGVAALMVVGYHAIGFYWIHQLESGLPTDAFQHALSRWGLGAGWLGVDVFFVLSGFLLAQPLLRRTNAWPTWMQYRVYAANRFLRIAPPYYASFLLVYLLAGTTGHPLFRFTTEGLLLHVAYAHGFFEEHFLAINGVAWTLSVELQFYLLLPVLALAFRRFGLWPVPVFAGLAVAYLAATQVADPWTNEFRAFQLPAFLGHFAFGIGAAWLWQRGWKPPVPPDVGIAAALLVLVAVPIGLLGASAQLEAVDVAKSLVWLRLTAGLAFAVVILLMLQPGCVAGRALALRPLRLLGEVSYSLYLVHYVVAGAFVVHRVAWAFEAGVPGFVVLVTAASLALACAFYFAIERPSLLLKDAVERRLRGDWAKRPTLATGPPPPSP